MSPDPTGVVVDDPFALVPPEAVVGIQPEVAPPVAAPAKVLTPLAALLTLAHPMPPARASFEEMIERLSVKYNTLPMHKRAHTSAREKARRLRQMERAK